MCFCKKKATIDDPLFIRVLQWASDRGSVGFKMAELKAATTTDEGEWKWVERMMLGEINGDRPLIFHLGGHQQGGGEYQYFLTGSGSSALMDYLELKEARKSGRNAMITAILSLLLVTASIGVQIYFSKTSPTQALLANKEMCAKDGATWVTKNPYPGMQQDQYSYSQDLNTCLVYEEDSANGVLGDQMIYDIFAGRIVAHCEPSNEPSAACTDFSTKLNKYFPTAKQFIAN